MAKYNAVAPFETFIFIPLDIIGQLFGYFYGRLTSRLLYFANLAILGCFQDLGILMTTSVSRIETWKGPGEIFGGKFEKHPVLCLRLENGSNIRTQLTGNNLLFTNQ